MAQVTGKVYKIFPKEFSGKMNYSIKLEDNPIYYRAGTKSWAGIAEPGNTVTFEAEINSDGKSAKIVGDVTKARAEPGAGIPSTGGGGREASIHYQSSRKDAVEFLKLAFQTEAIVLPKATKGRLGILEAALDKYTAQFYEDIGTLGAVARTAEGGEEAADEGEESDGDEE